MMRSFLPILGLAIALGATLPRFAFDDSARETGKVTFRRGVDEALALAKSERKPAFVLFDEIPGCATCKGFGDDALSQPLIVAAIERCFVPVLVYNNRPEDRAVLDRFDEPAWNNPVVRFLDGDGKDVIPRQDGVYDSHSLVKRMIRALTAAKNPIPAWLDLAELELDPDARGTIVFDTACFWEGEGKLGGIAGVVETYAGFLDGKEVVAVKFVRARADVKQLIEQAFALECVSRVHVEERDLELARAAMPGQVVALDGSVRRAPDADQKHELKRSPYAGRFESLTETQRARVNAALFQGQDPTPFLQ